jgi:hypothetical protein
MSAEAFALVGYYAEKRGPQQHRGGRLKSRNLWAHSVPREEEYRIRNNRACLKALFPIADIYSF